MALLHLAVTTASLRENAEGLKIRNQDRNPIMKIITTICAALLLNIGTAISQQDTALIGELIRSIEASQVTANGEFYPGMFPSFRQCGGAPHNYQPDNNIFFTAIGAFTLNNLLPFLEGDNKEKVDEILQKAKAAFPYYRDHSGLPYYNFWPTDAPIMPHTYYFQYLKSVFGQGEDADDSVMILMAADSDDSTSHLLKQRLISVSNLNRKKIISTYRKYRDYPAYSTYLGERMTPDFDFCVHCNVLYFTYSKHLPLVKQDTATIDLLSEMIRSREYMKAPVYLSPYYCKSSILIYHIARLLGSFNIPTLAQYEPQLRQDAEYLLSESTNMMDQILLRTSIIRLGGTPPPLPLKSLNQFEKSNQQQFIFFQARAAFSYPSPFKQIFLHWSYITYYFYCPAYNRILLLEYLLYAERLQVKKS